MFHRSRTKIMLSIMGSLILLFLITLALILLASYREIRQNNTEMLERYADLYYLGQPTVEQRAQEPEPNRTEEIAEDWNGPGQGSKPEKPPIDDRPDYQLSTFYAVAIADDGTVLASDNGEKDVYSEEELSEIAVEL